MYEKSRIIEIFKFRTLCILVMHVVHCLHLHLHAISAGKLQPAQVRQLVDRVVDYRSDVKSINDHPKIA